MTGQHCEHECVCGDYEYTIDKEDDVCKMGKCKHDTRSRPAPAARGQNLTCGDRCKTNKTLRSKLFSELDKMKKEGKMVINPYSLGKKFKIEGKRCIAIIREREDIYRIKACQELGVGSVWGFKCE